MQPRTWAGSEDRQRSYQINRSQDSFGGAISADGLAAPTADGCDLGAFELQLRLHASPTRLVQGAAAPTGQLSGYGFSAGD